MIVSYRAMKGVGELACYEGYQATERHWGHRYDRSIRAVRWTVRSPAWYNMPPSTVKKSWYTHRVGCDLRYDWQQPIHLVMSVLVCPSFQLFHILFDLGFLCWRSGPVCEHSPDGIARHSRALCLLGEMLLCDLLVVRIKYFRRHALHTEDLDIEALSVRNRIFDVCERLLVDLIHVHRET